jgi:hypothetical protein
MHVIGKERIAQIRPILSIFEQQKPRTEPQVKPTAELIAQCCVSLKNSPFLEGRSFPFNLKVSL